MKIAYLKYCLFFILALPIDLQAQSPTEEYLQSEVAPEKFDHEHWKAVTKDMDFVPEKKKDKKERVEKEEEPSFFDSEEWSMFVKFLLIMSFVAIIALIIKKALDNKNKSIKKTVSASDEEIIEEIEENFHESDIEFYIKKAIKEGNYALATRLYYLNILKSLSAKNIIKWKKDKTNRAYLLEIKNVELKHDFRQLTTIFERVWYGEIRLKKEEFESISPVFEGFSSHIKIGEPK